MPSDDWDDVMTSLGLEPSAPRPPRRPSPFARGIRPIAKCGTPSGANRHYNLGEGLCEPCRMAHNEAARVKYANRRAKRSAA